MGRTMLVMMVLLGSVLGCKDSRKPDASKSRRFAILERGDVRVLSFEPVDGKRLFVKVDRDFTQVVSAATCGARCEAHADVQRFDCPGPACSGTICPCSKRECRDVCHPGGPGPGGGPEIDLEPELARVLGFDPRVAVPGSPGEPPADGGASEPAGSGSAAPGSAAPGSGSGTTE